MLRQVLCGMTIALIWHGSGQAQQLPSVEKLIQDHDRNHDGKLTKEELKESSFVRQFTRWDADGDAYVSEEEIIAFRAKFGISADGSRMTNRRGGGAGEAAKPPQNRMLPIPDADDMTRADASTRLTASERRNSAYVLKTQPHEASGEGYVILTDHRDEAFLDPLRRLAEHRDGVLLPVDDLAALGREQSDSIPLMERLQALTPKYVAVAPRIESMRENMLMHVWELLAQIDDDPQLDAYPGFLIASNAEGLSRLVDQSIRYETPATDSLMPIAISQVPTQTELRSLQKSAILRQQFGSYGLRTPIIAVYTPRAKGAPELKETPVINGGEKVGPSPVWNLATTPQERLVRSFESDISQALDAANLVIMHGHGSPGMSCSLSISALPQDCSGKLLLTGSCFSAVPKDSDMASMREAPGGYAMTDEDAFVLRAIDSGAVAAFGHMRLSQGFPHLYAVLESWTRGETIGQSYQQLINGLIEKSKFDSRSLVMNSKELQAKSPKQNVLMYVLVGDPALQPLAKMID